MPRLWLKSTLCCPLCRSDLEYEADLPDDRPPYYRCVFCGFRTKWSPVKRRWVPANPVNSAGDPILEPFSEPPH